MSSVVRADANYILEVGLNWCFTAKNVVHLQTSRG